MTLREWSLGKPPIYYVQKSFPKVDGYFILLTQAFSITQLCCLVLRSPAMLRSWQRLLPILMYIPMSDAALRVPIG